MPSYTFDNVRANHTLQAVFVEGQPTPTEDEIVRMFIKMNGLWVPLFEEVNA